MISKAALVEALEKRFDYVSTRAILRESLSKADLADKDQYGSHEVSRFLDALKTLDKRIDKVVAHLATLGVAPAADAPAAAAPVVPPAPEPAPEAPAAEPAATVDEATPASDEAAPASDEPAPATEEAAPAADEAPAAESDDGDKKGKKKKK